MNQADTPSVEGLMQRVSDHEDAYGSGDDVLVTRDAIRAYAERLASKSAAAPPIAPVAWRSRGYGQYKLGQPGPWGYRTGAERPRLNDPSCCDIEPLYAAPPLAVLLEVMEEPDDPFMPKPGEYDQWHPQFIAGFKFGHRAGRRRGLAAAKKGTP